MNPQQLVKGCGQTEYDSFRMLHLCGHGGFYCHTCKARMEQALFEKKKYLTNHEPIKEKVTGWTDSGMYYSMISVELILNIEILEKALNIHSPRVDTVQVVSTIDESEDRKEGAKGSLNEHPLGAHNQEVKP